MDDIITNNNDFLDASILKNNLSINQDNKKHDDKLADIIHAANSEVQKRIKPYTNDKPLDKGNPFYKDAVYTTILYARAIWFESNFNLEKSKTNMKYFEEKIKSLTESLSIEPTSRTEPVIEVTDFASERKVPFSQIGYGLGHEDYVM